MASARVTSPDTAPLPPAQPAPRPGSPAALVLEVMRPARYARRRAWLEVLAAAARETGPQGLEALPPEWDVFDADMDGIDRFAALARRAGPRVLRLIWEAGFDHPTFAAFFTVDPSDPAFDYDPGMSVEYNDACREQEARAARLIARLGRRIDGPLATALVHDYAPTLPLLLHNPGTDARWIRDGLNERLAALAARPLPAPSASGHPGLPSARTGSPAASAPVAAPAFPPVALPTRAAGAGAEIEVEAEPAPDPEQLALDATTRAAAPLWLYARAGCLTWHAPESRPLRTWVNWTLAQARAGALDNTPGAGRRRRSSERPGTVWQQTAALGQIATFTALHCRDLPVEVVSAIIDGGLAEMPSQAAPGSGGSEWLRHHPGVPPALMAEAFRRSPSLLSDLLGCLPSLPLAKAPELHTVVGELMEQGQVNGTGYLPIATPMAFRRWIWQLADPAKRSMFYHDVAEIWESARDDQRAAVTVDDVLPLLHATDHHLRHAAFDWMTAVIARTSALDLPATTTADAATTPEVSEAAPTPTAPTRSTSASMRTSARARTQPARRSAR